jgi:hypothetical protein
MVALMNVLKKDRGREVAERMSLSATWGFVVKYADEDHPWSKRRVIECGSRSPSGDTRPASGGQSLLEERKEALHFQESTVNPDAASCPASGN